MPGLDHESNRLHQAGFTGRQSQLCTAHILFQETNFLQALGLGSMSRAAASQLSFLLTCLPNVL